jgi:hypothetical protein
MTLWTIKPSQDHDVYTVVYLLKDALRSALSDAWYFERTALPETDLKGAGHDEIAAKLGRFRDSCKTFEEREALMVMKLLRARSWAQELRGLAHDFQIDIDAFLEATAACEKIQSGFLRDTQRMFNGGMSLVRFLAQRKPEPGAPKEAAGQPPGMSYLVGGRTALYELHGACEAFLAQIDAEFFASEREAELAPMPYFEQQSLEPDYLEAQYMEPQQEPPLLSEIVH